MTGAEVIALVTGLPSVIAAITALIIAIKGGRAAIDAQDAVIGHIARNHPADYQRLIENNDQMK